MILTSHYSYPGCNKACYSISFVPLAMNTLRTYSTDYCWDLLVRLFPWYVGWCGTLLSCYCVVIVMLILLLFPNHCLTMGCKIRTSLTKNIYMYQEFDLVTWCWYTYYKMLMYPRILCWSMVMFSLSVRERAWASYLATLLPSSTLTLFGRGCWL